MKDIRVDLIHGDRAHALLRDDRFIYQWRMLFESCPHATAFQHPGFVATWYKAYRERWHPLIVRRQNTQSELIGLWLLAHDPRTNELAHAGAHQAEYHVWLAKPGEDVALLTAAWLALKRHFSFAKLRFKYLPDAGLGNLLKTAPGLSKAVTIRKCARPLLRLESDEIKASFAKKSNKSRFNRLKKLGTLEFRRITDNAELERVFDDLISFYDFRQGAVNRTTPFRDDPLKRRFHRALFTAAPNDTFVTVTYLDSRPIAAFWGIASGKIAHLGMLIHSPMLAEHSPGKLHVMQLSEYLLGVGKDSLDLTPGGDAWKERFANAHDEVAEAVAYRFALTRICVDMLDSLLQWGKRCAAVVGITPPKVRAIATSLRRLRPTAVWRKVLQGDGSDNELRIYRVDRTLAQQFRRDDRIKRDSLSDLLSLDPGESKQTHDLFLSDALARLEDGAHAYTVTIDNRLALCGWMMKGQTDSTVSAAKFTAPLPSGSIALCDFFSHPNFRGRGLFRAIIAHMLQIAFTEPETQFVYVAALSGDQASRHVIETMGFAYHGSYYLRRSPGSKEQWIAPATQQSASPNA